MTYKAILFDLDGTLLDSAIHFHAILRKLAKEADLPEPSIDLVRSWASNGAAVMVEKCLNVPANSPQYKQTCERFLELYDTEVHTSCPLFEGIQSLLKAISAQKLPIGIITNKGRRFYQFIEPQIDLIAPIKIGITGDDVSQAKPNPEGLIKSSQALSVNISECLYVGDHKRDIEAAHNAKMPSAIANWGYIQPEDKPESWNASHILNTPSELIDLL